MEEITLKRSWPVNAQQSEIDYAKSSCMLQLSRELLPRVLNQHVLLSIHEEYENTEIDPYAPVTGFPAVEYTLRARFYIMPEVPK